MPGINDMRLKRLIKHLTQPETMVPFHATMTATWILLIPPTLLCWRNSVPWLIAMSLWANVAAHWSGLQGALGDRRTKKENKTAKHRYKGRSSE
jgi:hypothetical protein